MGYFSNDEESNFKFFIKGTKGCHEESWPAEMVICVPNGSCRTWTRTPDQHAGLLFRTSHKTKLHLILILLHFFRRKSRK